MKRPGRSRGDRALFLASLAGSVVALVATHAMLVGYGTFANVDEAYAAALASRLLDGYRLYEGAISQRGPLMYLAYALMVKLTGWDDVAGLRLWALGFSALQVGLVAWAGARLYGLRVAALAGAVMAYVLTVGLPPIDGLALHGETMQAPAILAGATIAVFATRREGRARVGLLVGAGLLFGAAIAIKQSALLQPLPVVLLLLSDARRAKRRALPWRDLGVFTSGVAAIPAVLLLDALRTGTLPSLLYYCFTYNVKVHLRPSDALLARETLLPLADLLRTRTGFVLTLLALLALGAAYAARRLRAAKRESSAWTLLRGFGVRRYLVAHVLVGAFAASTMYRFFPHYYVPILPILAIVVAAWVERRARAFRAGGSRFATAMLVVVTLVTSGFTAYAYEKIDGRVTHSPTVQGVARYVEATTSPDARIFVWGFSPWLYPYAHRKPAGRYVFETYVTGFVPWYFDALEFEKSRVVPGSMEALLGDLVREEPEVVVDAGSVLLARPMRAYPEAAAFLHERYCFELRVGAFDVYRRKPADGCADDVFPTAHPPVDFFGAPMAVPMPMLVDEADAKPLCLTEDGEATWMPGAKLPKEALEMFGPASATKEDERRAHREAGIVYPSELRPTCDAPPSSRPPSSSPSPPSP